MSMSDLRACKECGKLFQPKGREQYCSEIHYRPCPECGEPVVAKYLSDPPRRCEKCKNIRSKDASNASSTKFVTIKMPPIPVIKLDDNFKSAVNSNKPKVDAKPVEIEIDLSDTEKIPERRETEFFCSEMSGSTVRFIRKQPLCGWVPGKDYKVDVTHDVAAYIVTCNENNNKISLRCASQVSFFNYFRKVVAE